MGHKHVCAAIILIFIFIQKDRHFKFSLRATVSPTCTCSYPQNLEDKISTDTKWAFEVNIFEPSG